MINIGIYGATGSWDFGDYCMVLNNIIQMDKHNNSTQFYIFTPNISVTREYVRNNIEDQELFNRITYIRDSLFFESKIQNYIFRIIRKILKIDLFYYRSLNIWNKTYKGENDFIKTNIVEEIENLDVLVFNGGGYFQNSWGTRNLDFCSVINIAACSKVPVYFMGNSFGPLDNIYKKYVASSLSYARRILIRDGSDRSYKFLVQNGVWCDKLTINTDDLIFYTTEKLKQDIPVQKENARPYIIIEIMTWITRAKKGVDSVLIEIKKFISNSIENGFCVYLISFDKTDKVAQKCINQIADDLDNQYVFVVDSVDYIYEVYNLYRNAIFSVSMKYHPVILSIANEVPCVGIICDDDGYYESKMHGAYESNGISADFDLVRELDNVTSEWLITALQNRGSFNIDLQRKIKMMEDRSDYLERIVTKKGFVE